MYDTQCNSIQPNPVDVPPIEPDAKNNAPDPVNSMEFDRHREALALCMELVFREIREHLTSIAMSTFSDQAVVSFLHDCAEQINGGAGPAELRSPVDDDALLNEEISRILNQLGFPSHLRGFHFLREAIFAAVRTPEVLDGVTKVLYPNIAARYQTTASRVERAIRHAIEVAWERGDLETLNRMFGCTISSTRGKPTNSEFIARIADQIKLQHQFIN